MTSKPHSGSMLGVGAMGGALAQAVLDAGRTVTVWNRTPGRAAELVSQGASEAATAGEALLAGGPVFVCLFDHASVHQTLDPLAESLRGRAVVNLTTTTPAEARELAGWAQRHGIAYLDGAIMATPPMIGGPGSHILYSGSRSVFDEHRQILDLWATSTHEGDDAGLASLFDLAILAGMYPLFAGFLHGAAMVQSAGIEAAEFAERAAPFLSAMTASFPGTAATVDGATYETPLQSLDWTRTALETIARASRELDVDPVPIDMVTALVRGEIDAGHGAEDFNRIIEQLRPRA